MKEPKPMGLENGPARTVAPYSCQSAMVKEGSQEHGWEGPETGFCCDVGLKNGELFIQTKKIHALAIP